MIQIQDLKKYFPITRGVFQRHVGDVKAVDGLSFDIYRGETLGLVGESGCAKSTTGRTILQLYRPTAGKIFMEDMDLSTLKGNSLRQMRQRIILEGDVPSPAHSPQGCNFNTRCPIAADICFESEPEFKEETPNHWVACYFAGTL